MPGPKKVGSGAGPNWVRLLEGVQADASLESPDLLALSAARLPELKKAAKKLAVEARRGSQGRKGVQGGRDASSWLAVQGVSLKKSTEHVFASHDQTLRFLERQPLQASLELAWLKEPVRVTFEDHRGDLLGKGTFSGEHPFEIQLTRATGECVITFSDGSARELSLKSDPAALRKLQRRLLAPHLVSSLGEIVEDRSLSDQHRAAAFSVLGLQEGRWGLLEYLDEVKSREVLTEKDARVAPLLYAYHTASGKLADVSAHLRENLKRISTQWAGSPEGQMLELALQAEAGISGSKPAVNYLVLTAGVRAALAAIEAPPEDGAAMAKHILAGYRWACNTEDNERLLKEDVVTALAKRCLDQVSAVLPTDHVARAAMEPFDLTPSLVSLLREPSIYGLRIGRLRYALETGESPPELPAGSRSMPDMCLHDVMRGALLKRFSAETLKTENISKDNSAQGNVSSCYYVSGWSAAMLRRPEEVKKRVEVFEVRHETEPEVEPQQLARISLFAPNREGRLVPRQEWVDPVFYTDPNGTLLYAGDRSGSADPEATNILMALLEKAFAYRRKDDASYDSISNGNGCEVFKVIFGSDDVHQHDLGYAARGEPLEKLVDNLKELVRQRIPATVATHPEHRLYKGAALYGHHVYLYEDVRKTEAGWEVQLMNLHRPDRHASKTQEGGWFLDVHKELRSTRDERIYKEKTQKVGTFVVPLEDFDKLFAHLDWIKL